MITTRLPVPIWGSWVFMAAMGAEPLVYANAACEERALSGPFSRANEGTNLFQLW